MEKSPVEIELQWDAELRFHAVADAHALTVDSDGEAGPSPMQYLALSLAGCMSIDVVHILGRMRTPPEALRVELVGRRADNDPGRFARIELRFVLRGVLPASSIERAIELSREKYCSVWHSLHPDIELRTAYAVET